MSKILPDEKPPQIASSTPKRDIHVANNYLESEKNEMEIDGFKALIAANPDTNMFRCEFVDRNGGAEFLRY